MGNTSLEKYVETTVASVSPLKQESIAILAEAKKIVVADDASLVLAIEMKKRISKQNTSVEVARKQYTAPLDGIKEQLMDLERNIKVELDEAKSYIAGQILSYEEKKLAEKEAEDARVQSVAESLEVNTSKLTSIDELKAAGAEIKKKFSELSEDDQANPIIKACFLREVNAITSEVETLTERIRQAEEDERLAQVAAEQSAERAALEKQKSEQAAEDRRIAREREELDRRRAEQEAEDERRAQAAAEEKAAKLAPKTNSVMSYTFTITDESKVPAEYCSPDEAKIRAAVKASKGTILIPGVQVNSERKSR